MLVNVIYEMDFDIIDVPDSIANNINDIQQEFFNWLFDESNDHGYWIISNGIKCCAYGTKEFVKWINDNLAYESDEKAKIISRNLTGLNNNYPTIYF